GPLLRLRLIRMGKNSRFAILVAHHIIFDGLSIRILLDEWLEQYVALSEGRTPKLPELACQYADYASWQQANVDSPRFHKDLEFWKVQLAAPLPALDLHADLPRPPRRTWDGAVAEAWLEPKLSAGMLELSQHKSRMLFPLLLAAWNIL